MIGIFGKFNLNSDFNGNLEGLLKKVPERLEKILFRGKNYIVGMANHDLSHGGSYFKDKEKAVCLLIGEIYNIKNNLSKNSAQHIYEIIKEKKYEKLSDINGLFTAIVIDSLNNTFTFVSDRLGTWPLFIWKNKNEFIFSNNLYLLLGTGQIKVKQNTTSIAQLFSMQRTFGNVTTIEGVDFFPPASIKIISKEGIKVKKYWNLEFSKDLLKKDEAPYILSEALTKTMNNQGDGGLLLSGGIDSRMLLAASKNKLTRSWTCASYEKNPELAIAKEVSELSNVEHQSIIVHPSETLDVLDETVKANNGMYPASTPMSAFLPKVATKDKTIITGHGLDYTFRGYYLPAKFLRVAGSKTRLPALKKFNKKITTKDVYENLRQGPPIEVVEKIFGGKSKFSPFQTEIEKLFDSKLMHLLDSKYPQNAWDAFILDPVSQHYAFTGMMAVRDVAVLRIPAFDNEVFNIYLNLTPEERISGKIVLKTLSILSKKFSKIKNANTLMRADLGPNLEILALIFRAMLRRIGMFKPPKIPSPMHSYGSWQNTEMLYRLDKKHIKRFGEIKDRLDWLSCGVLSVDSLKKCIDEHMQSEFDHSKLLRQLLTHDAWMRVTNSV